MMVLPCSGTDRQHDSKDRSASRATVDRDVASIGFDGPPGNGEPEPGATAIPRSGLVQSKEPIEDSLTVVHRNPRSFIRDRHNRLIAVGTDANVDRGTARAVLDRVVDDIREGFAQDQTVSRDGNGVGCVNADTLAPFFGEDPQ